MNPPISCASVVARSEHEPLIPISQPFIDERTEKLVLEVLRSGQLARGIMTDELEHRFSELIGSAHAIAVSSGTTALELALGETVAEGAVVVTTPFTFVATINAAIRAGAKVRFVDIGSDFNLDTAELESLDDDRTKVVVPVHLYGQPCDMSAITDIARRRGWTVVEDAAQAVGARWDNKPVGSFGIGCFSLYATKNVTTGEGGIITTDDDGLAHEIRTMINQGMESRYDYKMIGTNRRLTDLQAAVALPQLDDLSRLIEARRRNAHLLTEGLSGLPGLETPIESSKGLHVYHQFTVRITGESMSREEFSQRLASKGIATGIYYPRVVFDYDCFRDHPLVEPGPVPRARTAARQVVSLPVHPALETPDIERIISVVREAFDA